MTDFGLIGKAIDYFKSAGQDRKEKKLRERLVEIVNKLDATGENTYRPIRLIGILGSRGTSQARMARSN